MNAPRSLFAPKKGGKRLMRCEHCDQTFTEDKVTYGHKFDTPFYKQLIGKLWWCPTPKCNGAGVGFDIFPYPAESDDDA